MRGPQQRGGASGLAIARRGLGQAIASKRRGSAMALDLLRGGGGGAKSQSKRAGACLRGGSQRPAGEERARRLGRVGVIRLGVLVPRHDGAKELGVLADAQRVRAGASLPCRRATAQQHNSTTARKGVATRTSTCTLPSGLACRRHLQESPGKEKIRPPRAPTPKNLIPALVGGGVQSWRFEARTQGSPSGPS